MSKIIILTSLLIFCYKKIVPVNFALFFLFFLESELVSPWLKCFHSGKKKEKKEEKFIFKINFRQCLFIDGKILSWLNWSWLNSVEIQEAGP